MTELSVFAHALEITDPAERAAYLDQVCAGNTELRRQVEELLRANQDAGSSLATPAVGTDDTSATPGSPARASSCR